MSHLKKIQRLLDSHTAENHPRRVHYLLLVLGGALMGGTALALLNRTTIQRLREDLERPPAPLSNDEIY